MFVYVNRWTTVIERTEQFKGCITFYLLKWQTPHDTLVFVHKYSVEQNLFFSACVV